MDILGDPDQLKDLTLESSTALGRFTTNYEEGEEDRTAHTYRVPDSDYFVHVGVFYTDEYLSTEKMAQTMQIGVEMSTNPEATEGRTPRGSTASVTYDDRDFVISVATNGTVHGLPVRLIVDCCGVDAPQRSPLCRSGIEGKGCAVRLSASRVSYSCSSARASSNSPIVV